MAKEQTTTKLHLKTGDSSSYLHVLVLSADKVRQEFTLVGEIDGTDGARDLATGAC